MSGNFDDDLDATICSEMLGQQALRIFRICAR